MANYCILGEDNVIENIIVIDDPEMVEYFGGVPTYDGCRIGEKYLTLDERLAKMKAESISYKSMANYIREGVNESI